MKLFKVLAFLILSFGLSSVFASERQALDESVKSEIRAVLSANESLHASFFEYDAEKIVKNATKVSEKIDKISDDSIRQLLRFSQQQLGDMSVEDDRDENDQRYHIFSMAMIHLINTYDIGEGFNAYSCPMVKKKWVQNSTAMDRVHNPYDPSMPHCGDKDTKF